MFARRALQRRLNELRGPLGNKEVSKLAARLNEPCKDRLAAMWEVAVLHGLMHAGMLQHEKPLLSGHRPDVTFENEKVQFTADITTVSDDGFDSNNPYFELSQLIEKWKTKRGLPRGGVDLRIKSKQQPCGSGFRTVLRLPPRAQLQTFVAEQIIPQLKDQMASGEKVLHVEINDENVGIALTINPKGAPYSSAGFAVYDIPKTKDYNPIFYALKQKSSQLRNALGIKGVILCDGDCKTLSDHPQDRDEVSATVIVENYLQKHSSIDFVLFLKVREEQYILPNLGKPKRWIEHQLVVRKGCQEQGTLNSTFEAMLAELPRPITMPANGALRARETGYDLGHHGGYTMGGNKIRISSRELIEVLAGLRTLGDNGAKFVAASRKLPQQPNAPQSAFLGYLQQGRLPTAISVIKTEEDDSDDWIEFEFGSPDPAITLLR